MTASVHPARILCMRQAIVALFLLGLFAVLMEKSPIPQPASYHDFADAAYFLGIPSFWNVVSNVPFLVIGIMGLRLLGKRAAGASLSWAVVFVATTLVFFGSSYYHLAPSNATLVWDRIPIGIAFMGFLVALLSEHAPPRIEVALHKWLLVPAIVFSIATIYWWRFTGDLAPWIWVQAAPMLAIVLATALLRGRYTHQRYLFYALGCYALAKVLELEDQRFMEWSGDLMGGHAMKHFLAAAGVWWFYFMLKRRKRKHLATRIGQ